MNSSFSITRRGSREKVKAALATEVALPKEAPQAQVKAAVAYLTSQIDALPTEFNGVALTANGECQDNRIVLHTAVVTGEKLDL
jgi:hypothetical protein